MISYNFTVPLTWVDRPSDDEELEEILESTAVQLMCGDKMVAWVTQFTPDGSVYGGSILIERTGPTDMTVQEMKDRLEANVRTYMGPDTMGNA